MSATKDAVFSTFLIEMAFDRAGVKARLAALLLAERTRRGGGDPRRFAQPKMAAELGYSLRQYQRLEDDADPNLPTWANVEQIAEKLGIDIADIFGDDSQAEPAVTQTPTAAPALEAEALRDVLRAELQEIAGRDAERLDRMEAMLAEIRARLLDPPRSGSSEA